MNGRPDCARKPLRACRQGGNRPPTGRNAQESLILLAKYRNSASRHSPAISRASAELSSCPRRIRPVGEACAAGCAIFMRMAGSTPMGTKKAPAFAKPRLRGDVRRRRRNKRGLTRIRDRGMKGPTQFPARASGAGPKSRAFIEAPFLARKLRLGGVVSRGSGRFAIRSSPCLSCPPMIPSA